MNIAVIFLVHIPAFINASFPIQGKTMREAVDDKAKECRVDKKSDAIVYDTTKSMTGNQIGTVMQNILCDNQNPTSFRSYLK